MIVVKIELWSAVTHERCEIGRMYIANDGRRSLEYPALGDYTAAVCRRGSEKVPAPLDPDGPKATRTAEVRDYPRLSYNVWRLVLRALRGAFPEG